MEWLGLLWPIAGWLCCWCSTPKWMFGADRVEWVVTLVVCGALLGPFGALMFLRGTGSINDKWARH